MKASTFFLRLASAAKRAFPKGLKTAWWLIKITIPVSFLVMLMDYFGLLHFIARYTGPLFAWFGLPAVAAIVLVTSIFTNVYSVVAIIALLQLPAREGIILGTMCLVSHNFVLETAVTTRTGSSVTRMLLVRLIGSFVIAWFLNLIMPGHYTEGFNQLTFRQQPFMPMFEHWAASTGSVVLKILILVVSLLILQQILEEFKLMDWLTKPFAPLMRVMGLPENTTISWIVANLIGLAYGSALMIDQVEKGKMRKQDADLLNHHIVLSHSQLEDPLLFLAIGYTIHWMVWPRVLIAILAVWLRRMELKIKGISI